MKMNCIYFTIVVIFGCLLQNFQASPISESSSFEFPVESNSGEDFVFPVDSQSGEDFVFPEDSDIEDSAFVIPSIYIRRAPGPQCIALGRPCKSSAKCCSKRCTPHANICVS